MSAKKINVLVVERGGEFREEDVITIRFFKEKCGSREFEMVGRIDSIKDDVIVLDTSEQYKRSYIDIAIRNILSAKKVE